jgi:arginyl-tRNA--protein-N-Asp/Glu arginylyltransferase
MKLIFSEHNSDYSNYLFPYAIWAIPEVHETPAMIFTQGFLPSSRELDRFYLCRHIRINLKLFKPSSENRRILRKGEGIHYELIPQVKFEYTEAWREFCKNYADIKFGKDIMTYQRLDSLFNSKIISHLLLFTDIETNQDVGIATLYLEDKTLSYYYYAFYDLNYYTRNLGMYMMTSAVDYFAQSKFDYIYLGTCYSCNALYKTQFSGFEFFNGFRWSDNLKELKYLIQRDKSMANQHLVETEDYVKRFYEGELQKILEYNGFRINIQ